MTVVQSIILGVVQGLTEFIPVSSSAHLVIVPYLMNWQIPADQAFVFGVLVQLASLVAVFVYFWKDLITIVKAVVQGLITRAPLRDSQSRLGWFLILATVPAGLIGLLIKDVVEQAFSNPAQTALFLFITAGMLVLAERIGKQLHELDKLSWKDALWIGFFQAAAIFPGISRSGATITGGMTRDLKRPAAARFAFLLSVPVMLAAGLLATNDLLQLPGLGDLLLVFIPGFIASAFVAYLAIRWLIKYLGSHSLYDFAIYCVGLGVVTLLVYLVRG
jgi:undecaprenyl-diphosphatase